MRDRAPEIVQIGQLVRLESLEPCPEPDVGRIGHLRLHAHQVPDLVSGRCLAAAEQVLPREQGAVEGALVEYLLRQSGYRIEPARISTAFPAIRITTSVASWTTGVGRSPINVVRMARKPIRSVRATGRAWR